MALNLECCLSIHASKEILFLMDQFVGFLYSKDEMFKERVVPRCLILALCDLSWPIFSPIASPYPVF